MDREIEARKNDEDVGADCCKLYDEGRSIAREFVALDIHKNSPMQTSFNLHHDLNLFQPRPQCECNDVLHPKLLGTGFPSQKVEVWNYPSPF
jgi:hypothetical protein